MADGGGYPRSILWPVDDTSPIADGLRTTPPLRWHYTREKKEKGGLGSTARTPRAISCNDEEKEEQDKEAAFNKSSSSRACGISTTKRIRRWRWWRRMRRRRKRRRRRRMRRRKIRMSMSASGEEDVLQYKHNTKKK